METISSICGDLAFDKGIILNHRGERLTLKKKQVLVQLESHLKKYISRFIPLLYIKIYSK